MILMNFSEFKKKYQKQEIVEYPNKVSASPFVSVLVQTYQHKNYIVACLNGILSQETNFPFEVIVGEDGSDDGTREICIEFAKRYPQKIKLFLHHAENKIKVMDITTGNFNALHNFFSAKGDFIAFCEGDDVWSDPLKLQKQADGLAQNGNYALIYHSFMEVDAIGEILPEAHRLDQPVGDIKKEDLQRLKEHPLLSTICFRNYLRDGIPEEMAEVINVDSFLLSLLGNYGGAKFQKEINNTLYRRHSRGIWSKRTKGAKLRSKVITYSRLKRFYYSKQAPETAEYFSQKIKEVKKTKILYLISDYLGIDIQKYWSKPFKKF